MLVKGWYADMSIRVRFEQFRSQRSFRVTLAENLKRLRLERFLSQAELAQRAGMSKATIIRLEAGTGAPYGRTIRQLAEALDVEPRELATPAELAEVKRAA